MSETPLSPKKKGKLKDFNANYDDLNPVITYRHMQTPTIGPRHPMRIIALCDCNAFYANCEQVRLGLDPKVLSKFIQTEDKAEYNLSAEQTPLVVLQWGMLIAVNYPAREFGISRMDKIDEALKRCPDLKVVHVATYAKGESEAKYWDKPDVRTHKICLDLYRRESTKIHTLFTELLPTGEVEKASIDEAFIDFSIPVRDLILERYPYLANPPPDALEGLDTPLPPAPKISFVGKGNLVPVDPTKLPPDVKATTEMVEEIENEVITTWHDVGLALAAELMTNMRKEVHEKLGYLTSAGIARNKFLAKLGASYRKFNTQNILRNSAIPGFLKPMPFQKIRFLGGKLGKAFAEEYDASTVGDLLSITLEEMQTKFGECSIWVYEILRGIDRSEVKEKGVINKSMNASKNLPKPITKPDEGPHWLRMLAAELAIRLSEAREQTPGLWPRTLALHASRGWGFTRSKQRPFRLPRGQAKLGVDFVYDEANKLWKELVEMLWGEKKEVKLTHLSLSFTGIRWNEEGQKGIEGFFQPMIQGPGERALSEGLAGPSNLDKVVNSVERKRSNSLAPSTASGDKATVKLDQGVPEAGYKLSYQCSRCHKIISVPSSYSLDESLLLEEDGIVIVDAAEIEKSVLEKLRIEHDDYHFAQDLARQDQPENSISVSKSMQKRRPSRSPDRSVKRKRKPKESTAQGIAKYFIKKPSST